MFNELSSDHLQKAASKKMGVMGCPNSNHLQKHKSECGEKSIYLQFNVLENKGTFHVFFAGRG